MHSGQGSLEYVLLVSGAILVAIIVIAGAIQTPQAPLGSSEYGLASAYCSATPLDGCFGKTVQSGSNSYACYLNSEGNNCLAQGLGSPGCEDGTCQSGENCPAENVHCTTPGLCQRYPPNGVCVSGCKYASLAKKEQVSGECDDTHTGGNCSQAPCECDGIGHCVNKDCDNNFCEPEETCAAEDHLCQSNPPVCKNPGTCSGGTGQQNGCVYPDKPQGPDAGRCDSTHGCSQLPCECDGSGNCVFFDCAADNHCNENEVCAGEDVWCNQTYHYTCQEMACNGGTGDNEGCVFSQNIPAEVEDPGYCQINVSNPGDCGSIPCWCNGLGNCIMAPVPLTACGDPPLGWQDGREYRLATNVTGENCFDITGSNITLDCQNNNVNSNATTNQAIVVSGSNVTIKNCKVVSKATGINIIGPTAQVRDSIITANKYGVIIDADATGTIIQYNELNRDIASGSASEPAGVQINSVNNTIANNSININMTGVPAASTARGITMPGFSGLGGQTIAQNSIIINATDGATAHGILFHSPDNAINGNTVTITNCANTKACLGIYFFNSGPGTGNSVTNNTISISGGSVNSLGIRLFGTVTNTLIQNNNVCGGSNLSSRAIKIENADPQRVGSNGNVCAIGKCMHTNNPVSSNVCSAPTTGNCNSNCQ